MKHVIMLFLLVLLLASCSNSKEPLGYHSFNHITHWDELETLEDGLVVLYFYSPYCLVCIAIEEDVFKYADLARANTPIYFIHSGDIIGQGEPDFEIPSTPTLIILEDRSVVRFERGPINTVEFLKSLSQK